MAQTQLGRTYVQALDAAGGGASTNALSLGTKSLTTSVIIGGLGTENKSITVNALGTSIAGPAFLTTLTTTGNSILANVSVASLGVSGNVSMANVSINTLNVVGPTGLNTLEVSALSKLQNVSVLGVLDVVGKATMGNVSTTALTATTLFATTINATGLTTLNNMSVRGNASILNLDVTGDMTTLYTNVSIKATIKNASVNGTLNVDGQSTLRALEVSGTTTFTNTVTVSGTDNSLTVNGITTLNNASVNGTLAVVGNCSLTNVSAKNLTVTGSSKIGDWFMYSDTNTKVLGTVNDSAKYALKQNAGETAINADNTLTDGKITFNVANDPKMTLTKNGYLGIGRTVPTAILDVDGTVKVEGVTDINTTGSGTTTIGSGTSATTVGGKLVVTGNTSVQNVSAQALTVGPLWAGNATAAAFISNTIQSTDTGTEMNIGRNQLAGALTIGDNSARTGAIFLGSYGAEAYISGKLLTFNTSTKINVNTETNGVSNNRITILNTGNVGIGTSEPGYTLDVSGQIQVKALSKHGSRFYPIEAVGAQGNITIGACFPGSGGDIAGRRVCDIYGGFTGYAWDTEYISFGVGTGADNNSNNPTTERMRISGGSNTVVRIGQSGYAGVAIDTTTNGLERSRHTINFSGYRHDDYNQIGASITCINKQTWIGLTEKQLIQSSDLVFSVNDNTYALNEKMRITYEGRVGIGKSAPDKTLDVAGTLGVSGHTTAASLSVSGNVGIGATEQLAKLHVADGNNTIVRIGPSNNAGTAADTSTFGLTRSTYTLAFSGYRDATASRVGSKIVSINKQTYSSPNEKQLVQSTNLIFYTTKIDEISDSLDPSIERMRITDAGYVGIGTSAPTCPLYVGTYASMGNTTTTPSGAWFNNSGGVFSTSSGTFLNNTLSIYAGHNIQSGGSFISTSDRRIKSNIIDVEDDRALRDLRLLKPKTYTYKDVNTRGTEPVYGFIAQEVKEVLNYASSLNKDTIPNIYELATFSTDTLTLTFNTADLARDASGALFTKLKVKTRELKDEFVNIVEVLDTNTIKVDKDLTEWGGQIDASGQVVPGDKIFVYGQEVNDFHNLNKDAIWTVATAALQEVDRQLQAEKQKTTEMQTTITALQSTLALALTRLDALEQKP